MSVCEMLKRQTDVNFVNLETAIHTYDRNALVCGASAWRYVYHAIHSADKWFFNPFVFEEPPFHEDGMDNPDNPCSVEFSDEQLLDYLQTVRQKTKKYLDGLTERNWICVPKIAVTRGWSLRLCSSAIFLCISEC